MRDTLDLLLAADEPEQVVNALQPQQLTRLIIGLEEFADALGIEVPHRNGGGDKHRIYELLDALEFHGAGASYHAATDEMEEFHSGVGLWENDDGSRTQIGGSIKNDGMEAYENNRHSLEMPAGRSHFIKIEELVENHLNVSLNSHEGLQIVAEAQRLAAHPNEEIYYNGKFLGYSNQLVGIHGDVEEPAVYVDKRLSDYLNTEGRKERPVTEKRRYSHVSFYEFLDQHLRCETSAENKEQAETYLRQLLSAPDTPITLPDGRVVKAKTLVGEHEGALTVHPAAAATVLENTSIKTSLNNYNKIFAKFFKHGKLLSPREALREINHREPGFWEVKTFEDQLRIFKELFADCPADENNTPLSDVIHTDLSFRRFNHDIFVSADAVDFLRHNMGVESESAADTKKIPAMLADKFGEPMMTAAQYIVGGEAAKVNIDKRAQKFSVFAESLLQKAPQTQVSEAPPMTAAEAIKVIESKAFGKVIFISKAARAYCTKNYSPELIDNQYEWLRGAQLCSKYHVNTAPCNIDAVNAIAEECLQKEEHITLENGATLPAQKAIVWGVKGTNEGYYFREDILDHAVPPLLSAGIIQRKAKELFLAERDELSLDETVRAIKGPDSSVSAADIKDLYAYLMLRRKDQSQHVVVSEPRTTLPQLVQTDGSPAGTKIDKQLIPYLSKHYLNPLPREKAHWKTGNEVGKVLGLTSKVYVPVINTILRNLWLRAPNATLQLGDEVVKISDVVGRFQKDRYVGIYVDPEYIGKIITADAVRSKAQSFGDLLDRYIRGGGDNFSQLFEQVQKEWACSREELCERIGLGRASAEMLQPERLAAGEFKLPTIEKIAAHLELSPQRKYTLSALRLGTLHIGSVEQLVVQAKAILEAKEPRFEDFSDNKIAQKMAAMHEGLKKGVLQHSLVPNALLSLLLERSGVKPSTLMDKVGLSTGNRAVGDILSGKDGYIVHRQDSSNRVMYFPEFAKPTGEFFTNNSLYADAISLIMLEIPRRCTPAELVAQVKSGEMPREAMVRRLRLQKYMKLADVSRYIDPEGGSDNKLLARVEGQGSHPILDPVKAHKLADLFYKDFPDDSSKSDFIDLVMHKDLRVAPPKASMEKLEERIRYAYENPNAKDAEALKDWLDDMVSIAAEGNVKAFTQAIPYQGKEGKQGIAWTTFFNWKKGVPLKKATHAEAMADLMVQHGMNNDVKPMLIAVAMQKNRGHAATADIADEAQPEAFDAGENENSQDDMTMETAGDVIGQHVKQVRARKIRSAVRKR